MSVGFLSKFFYYLQVRENKRVKTAMIAPHSRSNHPPVSKFHTLSILVIRLAYTNLYQS